MADLSQYGTITKATPDLSQYGTVSSQTPAAAAPKSDDEIIRSFGYDPSIVKTSHFYVPGHLLDTSTATKAPYGKFLESVGEGVYKVPAGVFQLAVHGANKLGIASDADVQYNDLLEKVHSAAYKQATGGDPSTAGELLGSALIPIPGGAAKTLLGTVAKGALTGTAAGVAQPVDVAGPGGDYFAPKAKQALTGAVVGGATGGVIGGVARAVSSRGVELPEEMAARAKAGGEQQVSQLETALQNTPFAGNADVGHAASAGDRSAIALTDQMINAKTPAQIQQASIGLANWRTKQTATKLYDKVGEAITKHPDIGDVPLDETAQTISDALDQAKRAKDPDVHLINFLKTVQRNIGGGTEDATGSQFVDNSYGQIRQFRSDLGERISALRSGSGKQLLGPSSAATLQQVRNAVDNDLRNFTANSGAQDVQRAADKADLYYSQQRVPFTASDIAKAGSPNLAGTTTDAEADQIFGKFIQAGKGDKAQRFFDALDPRGRAAVQYQMASDALNQATDQLHSTFDPAKFFNALDKTKEAYGVFFKGPDKAAMDGLKNLAQQAVLAGDKEAALKSTLNKVATGGAIATEVASRMSAPAGVTEGIGALTGIAAAARGLMLTDAGRRLLADASALKPGDPRLAFLLNKVLPATAARAATAQAVQ